MSRLKLQSVTTLHAAVFASTKSDSFIQSDNDIPPRFIETSQSGLRFIETSQSDPVWK